MNATTISAPPFTYVGETIAKLAGPAGAKVVIVIQWVRADVFSVTVRPASTGGRELDRCSYPTWVEAQAEANRMREVYRTRTHVEVEGLREQLAALIDTTDHQRSHAAALRGRTYQAQADAIQSLRGRAWDRRMGADVTETMSAALADALVG